MIVDNFDLTEMQTLDLAVAAWTFCVEVSRSLRLFDERQNPQGDVMPTSVQSNRFMESSNRISMRYDML